MERDTDRERKKKAQTIFLRKQIIIGIETGQTCKFVKSKQLKKVKILYTRIDKRHIIGTQNKMVIDKEKLGITVGDSYRDTNRKKER